MKQKHYIFKPFILAGPFLFLSLNFQVSHPSTASFALPKVTSVEFPIDITLHMFQYIMRKKISHKNQKLKRDIKEIMYIVRFKASSVVLEGQAR